MQVYHFINCFLIKYNILHDRLEVIIHLVYSIGRVYVSGNFCYFPSSIAQFNITQNFIKLVL